MNDKTKATIPTPPPVAPIKAGDYVRVLDWSRDPQVPVECSGYVDAVSSDGTIDVRVSPPAGIEPYVQVGLTECTNGDMKPGQWRRPDQASGCSAAG